MNMKFAIMAMNFIAFFINLIELLTGNIDTLIIKGDNSFSVGIMMIKLKL